MIVQKLKERFNPNPTVFDRYNNANGLTRYNATTSTYEIVTYRCLQHINPNYVYWRGQGPYNSHNVKCSFVKKRSGEQGILVSTLNKYARVWGRIGEIIDVCTFIGLDYQMMFLQHYRNIHDKITDHRQMLQAAQAVKRQLTFDLEKGDMNRPETGDGNNTEEEIENFAKDILRYSRRKINNYGRIKGQEQLVDRSIASYVVEA